MQHQLGLIIRLPYSTELYKFYINNNEFLIINLALVRIPPSNSILYKSEYHICFAVKINYAEQRRKPSKDAGDD